MPFIIFQIVHLHHHHHHHQHHHQSPIVNRQSSIINHQSSIIDHQSSIINHQSSTPSSLSLPPTIIRPNNTKSDCFLQNTSRGSLRLNSKFSRTTTIPPPLPGLLVVNCSSCLKNLLVDHDGRLRMCQSIVKSSLSMLACWFILIASIDEFWKILYPLPCLKC